MSLYVMMSIKKPVRYVEVGSGNSTKVAYKAKQEQKLNTLIISIDPQPRAGIETLVDKSIRQPFENYHLQVLDELEAGDILFIDNSHRML